MFNKIFEDFENQINGIDIPEIGDDSVNEAPISYADNPKDAAAELEDVYVKLQDGIRELALIIDSELDPWPQIKQRAKSMVLSHFETALDGNHSWMGGNMTTLEDIINELNNMDSEGNIQDESVVTEDLGKCITKRYNKDKFFSHNPTKVGRVANYDFYEHPKYGDEAPLVAHNRDTDEVGKTEFWELRDAQTELNNKMREAKKNGPPTVRNLPAKNMYQKGGAMKDRKKEKKKGMDRKKKHKKPLSQSY